MYSAISVIHSIYAFFQKTAKKIAKRNNIRIFVLKHKGIGYRVSALNWPKMMQKDTKAKL